MPKRTEWLHPHLDKEEIPYHEDNNEIYIAVVESQANLISSKLDNGLHLPVLDIDYEIKIEPSTTKGHFHLYLDGMEPLPWWKYRVLLKVLAWVGIIEKGYYLASVNRGMTLVRKPGIQKHVDSFKKMKDPKKGWNTPARIKTWKKAKVYNS